MFEAEKTVLKLSIELASTTQRDQFAERPHSLIKKNPASLDIAFNKEKPDEELGIHIKSTYSGCISLETPAKSCNKVEKGDEIVQVNYQTVIGWQQKKLVTAMTEHSMELHLTLKKTPSHKHSWRINKCHKWSDDNRLCCPDTCSTSNESECLRDDFNEDEDDSAFLPASANHLILNDPSLQLRLYSGPSMATVQRRATVSGASPTILKPPINIEDLVNGVPNVKTNDTFVRSISYDPAGSKFNSKFGSVFSENVNCIEPCKNNPNKEKKETPDKSADQPAVETEPVTDFNPPSTIYSYDTCSSNDINPALVLETLPVHEEEYTVLENKSLNKVDDYLVLQKEPSTNFITREKEKHCSSAEAKESCTVPSNIDITAAKHNIILYDWEGVDTEFCGRRPSAHDISNEIAGIKASEINPVLLRRASKLETSPMNTDTFQEKHIGDIGNYQVVVIAGVPQRCVPSSKEGKEKNKGFELSSHQHRVKDSFVGKFSSRRISCKDLGKGDCEGWLYKLKERKGFFPSGHHWVKRWIVLKDHFYILIKMKIWMNKMGLAAIAYDASADITTSSFTKPAIILGVANNFYSETEDSENGSPTCIRRTLENDKNY
ncbi:connector enhancer of kinase suppressor of ras 2 [Caerostris extrusa]|uniref:Connector enhancer of kinase suppressor of ras 2 n=1 Tax=Caerostris extrusa TaxID=172846 RepID=A0AAV4NN25_CAEEX|nr:connector enhancer of kinase suppressor of ras 2 [Caerostris extrusa]